MFDSRELPLIPWPKDYQEIIDKPREKLLAGHCYRGIIANEIIDKVIIVTAKPWPLGLSGKR